MIVKTAHMKEIRDYISKHHNKTFNEAFYSFSKYEYYSQFSIFCAYLFHFRRSEYKWYVHTETPKW